MFNATWQQFALASWQTIYMVFISGFISIAFGTLVGLLLYLTAPGSLRPHPKLYRVLGIIVNIGRSFPYIILMIAVLPLTRLLIGTTIGTNAAIVPLVLAAIPFYARVAESAFSEIPKGVVEAAISLGATTRQIALSVLIPEGLPSLIKGATLTLIALIGYSAMAGAIGGGGLGELAINYGYQQFDIPVMIVTVVLLIVLVQLVQWYGDHTAKSRSYKSLSAVSIVLWAACIFSQVGASMMTPTSNRVTIGVMSGAMQQVMAVAQKEAKDKYGLNLEVVPFSDYNIPNIALESGQLDANMFQHMPFLEAQIKAHGYKIEPIAKTFVFPMGVFSHKIDSLAQLKDGSKIAIPNDPSNEGRALMLFADKGLIKLKPGTGIKGTINSIVANPRHLKFILLDAAQIPRSLNDVSLAAINNDFLKPAGLKLSHSVFHEGPDNPYANLIVARKGDHNPLLKKLVAVLHSKPVAQKMQEIYPDGAAIPAWKGASQE
nr:MetQ/NlpA family ABC transporter substrate-binding protein [Dongshaea marina]